jgi:excinuclease ABC subunit A
MGGLLKVVGAAEHNLRDVDATIGPGLTAVVGVSGSGKSSFAFDVVYAEARRRFVESLALGGNIARQPAAHVRRIEGLGPAVSIAQNVLNRNSASTVATSVGLHPFLRVLYSRFAEVSCPRCALPVRAVSREERLAIALERLESDHAVDVDVAVVRGQRGPHSLLLTGIRDEARFDVVVIDGREWAPNANGRRARVPKLDPNTPHDIVVRAATIERGAKPAEVRATLERADALGSHEIRLNGTPVLRAPICPGCSAWVRPLEPSAFRDNAGVDTSSHTIGGVTLPDLLTRSVTEALEFVEQLTVGTRANRVQDELLRRLRPLTTLGLGHLTLDRTMPTLSRGESQRTRLAVVLAGRLDDLLHVLDEPTIGLHHTDLERLLNAIATLPGPVLMVEHDAFAIAMADDVIEFGPAGGRAGGELVFQGTPAALWKADTASGRGFSGAGRQRSTSGERARTVSDERIRITGARLRNLDNIDVEIPLGALTVITGPSGSGKTTLARHTLLASLTSNKPTGCDGFEMPTKVRALAVNQSPLGNNPRSNPATYTKVFDRIRDVFANATSRSPSEFTFNRAEGACPECEGMGSIEIMLRYIAPIWVACDACDGRRFRPEVLDAEWNGMSIADVLDCSVDEAFTAFAAVDSAKHKTVTRILDTLRDVGLGYITLGQPSPTLSGGEAQRVRLAREITKAKAGDLVLLDEPTTGLHPADLERLLNVLHRLTDKGCTVVVVEHQQDVIDAADWRVDLGPGGGPDGGRLMHHGPAHTVGAASAHPTPRPRTKPRARRRGADVISVRDARAHNLQSVDVDFAKNRFTVVTGVSGSGKSSLVNDVVAAEATRRLLECLSVYERQSVREGPEAPVGNLTGLGPTLVIDAATRITDLRDAARATVGRASDLDRLVATVLARAGTRTCLECGGTNVRRNAPLPEALWTCADCGASAIAIEPRNLVGSPLALCRRCLGLGVERRIVPEKFVKHPDKPICAGCFSGNAHVAQYLCGDRTGGSGSMRAFAERHGFDPRAVPWSELPEDVQHKFLYGDPEPYPVRLEDDGHIRIHAGWGGRDGTWWWRGFNPRGDFGGKHSEAVTCIECDGKRLRAPYLAIAIDAQDRNDLYSASLVDLDALLSSMAEPADKIAREARTVALRRLRFLRSVGLSYLHLDRHIWTLSAGEAQFLMGGQTGNCAMLGRG